MGWDKAKVVSEFRRLHARGADLSFTAQLGSGLWAASFRYFGSYRSAVEAAGLPYDQIWRRRLTTWDCDRICEELRKLFRAKHDISSRTLRRTHSKLHAAAIHWFGSYRKAIEAAKIDYDRVSRRSKNFWNRESIIKELRRLHKAGQPLHHAAMERSHPHLVVVAYRYFKTYRRAVQAAGIDYLQVRIRPPRTWDRSRVQRELKRMHRDRMGLWERQVRRTAPYLPRAAKQLFGSYPAAARAAGIAKDALVPPDYRYWSPQRVIDALQEMHRQNKPMYPARLMATQPYLLRVSAKRFGSYRKAIEAAGLEYPVRPLRHWSEALVLQTLRDLHAEGADLRYTPVKTKRLPLYEAARYYFGTYQNAVRVAGIDYDKVVARHLQRRKARPAAVTGRKIRPSPKGRALARAGRR